MMFKLPALAVAATLAAGAAQAIPAGYVFDFGPVIDFTDTVEVLEIDSFFPGVVDLAFSGPMTDTFSFDAGFDDSPVVDFAGSVDTLAAGGTLFDLPFLAVEEAGTILLESFDVVSATYGDFTLEVLFSDLAGSRAGDFGGFALVTIDLLDTPSVSNPWENATGFEALEIAGTIESVSAVPLPAGVWMLLAGIGAAGAVRMRRAA